MPLWRSLSLHHFPARSSHAAPAKPSAHTQLPSGCSCPCGWLHGHAVSSQPSSQCAPLRPSMHSHGGSSVTAPPLASHVPADEQCACMPLIVEQSISQCAPAKPSAHSHGGSSVAAPPLASHVPADEQCACVPLAVEQSAPQSCTPVAA